MMSPVQGFGGRRIGLALLVLFLGACGEPDGQLTEPNGAEQGFRFDQWHGRWLVVNYWAEWCAPCRHEIPELNALNLRDDVQVVGVNFDGIRGAKLQEVTVAMDVTFPTLVDDPGPRYGVERPRVLPTTLVIQPDGLLLSELRGPQTQQSLLQAMGLAVPEATAEGDTGAEESGDPGVATGTDTL